MNIPRDEITATSRAGFFRSSTKYDYRVTCVFRICARFVHCSPIDHFSVASSVAPGPNRGWKGGVDDVETATYERRDDDDLDAWNAIVAIHPSVWFATGETRRQLSAAVISAPLNC